MEFYPAADEQLELSTDSHRPVDTEMSTSNSSDDRQVSMMAQSTSMTPRSSQDPTAMTEPTGQERPSLETMPIVAPRYSTSQSGAASINIGGQTTDASESEPDTSEDIPWYAKAVHTGGRLGHLGRNPSFKYYGQKTGKLTQQHQCNWGWMKRISRLYEHVKIDIKNGHKHRPRPHRIGNSQHHKIEKNPMLQPLYNVPNPRRRKFS